jgi:hypothetical protein
MAAERIDAAFSGTDRSPPRATSDPRSRQETAKDGRSEIRPSAALDVAAVA